MADSYTEDENARRTNPFARFFSMRGATSKYCANNDTSSMSGFYSSWRHAATTVAKKKKTKHAEKPSFLEREKAILPIYKWIICAFSITNKRRVTLCLNPNALLIPQRSHASCRGEIVTSASHITLREMRVLELNECIGGGQLRFICRGFVISRFPDFFSLCPSPLFLRNA